MDALEAGDLFGTGALIGSPGSGLKIIGAVAGEIEVVSAAELLNRLADHPEFATALLSSAARRLQRLEQSLAVASMGDVRERLIHVLREVATKEAMNGSTSARVIPPGWSHVALARQVGVCRETITRGLAALAKAGVIHRQGRRILLLDSAQPSTTHGVLSTRRVLRIAGDSQRSVPIKAFDTLEREQLSNAERVKTTERLAASGLGVREISRRTGLNPSTISRWLRVSGRAELKQALESGRIDLARAVILVEAPAPALGTLLERAPYVSAAELRREVALVRRL
jgi:DNA-binding transcriptional ArsR family regulator